MHQLRHQLRRLDVTARAVTKCQLLSTVLPSGNVDALLRLASCLRPHLVVNKCIGWLTLRVTNVTLVVTDLWTALF